MGKGNVVYRDQADIACPNCGDGKLYYLWTFKRGTNRTAIREWEHEQKKQHCISLKEYCTSCEYNTLR